VAVGGEDTNWIE